MTYANRLVVIQEQGVLIVVILNGNKLVRSIKLNYQSGVEPIAPNGSGVNEVALLQNFKNSRNSKGQFHLTPCYMKCFFGRGKKKLNFLF